MAAPSIGAGYFSRDIEDFLLQLTQHRVRFLVVGGEAVIFHGHARLTGDIDVFYAFDSENVGNLFNALLNFWGGSIPGVESIQDFFPGEIIQFGVPPNRIDLLNRIDGVTFGDAWENRVEVNVILPHTDISLSYIGKSELCKNKEASGRPKDMQDLRFLQTGD